MKILKLLEKNRYEIKLNKTGLYRFVEEGSKELVEYGFSYKVKYPQDLFAYEVILNGIRNKQVIDECYNQFVAVNYDIFEYVTYKERQRMINQDEEKVIANLPHFKDNQSKEEIYIPFLEPFINKYYTTDYQLVTLKKHKEYIANYPRNIKNMFELYGIQPYNSYLSSLQLVGVDDEYYYFYHFDFKTVYQFDKKGIVVDEFPLIDKYTKEYPDLELIKEALALLANSDDEAKVVEFLHTNKFIGEKTYKKLLKKVSK